MSNPEFLDKVGRITEFCMAHQGRCFEGWRKEKIFFYVGFCLIGNACFVVYDNDNAIRSVVFAWPMKEQSLSLKFNWKLPERGRVLFVSEMFGARRYMRRVFDMVFDRWPDIWKVCALRHKGKEAEKLEWFTPLAVGRFVGL